MRRIDKGPPPASLSHHAAHPDATYDDYREKQDLREALVRDQRGLCCYCMRRIRATSDGVRIEHFRPRRHEELQLSWTNLLGACPGVVKNAREIHHTCDVSKGDQEISVDPQRLRPGEIRYLADGTITTADVDAQADIDDVLRLNHPTLVGNRRKVHDELIRQLIGAGGRGAWGVARLAQKLAEIREGPALPEFAGLMEFWLERRLRRLEPA
ncbi:MAG: TIGR02646 family protein [Deltaproteobacteria bacterium]|nr:TIGR02646 family protein [Deltaproteobacteria bacterium]MBK8719475.1 TIGR02646 family protein [Deltaproteobacteria bacterium]MBP7287564.1 TIGR02646 family protein [Nannocystaceae bacterium]